MKIVILDGYTLNPGDLSWDGLKQFGDVTIYDRTPVDKVVERAAGAEIIFTNKTPVSAEAINQLTSLKFIGVLATGYNIVDTETAKVKRYYCFKCPRLWLQLCGPVNHCIIAGAMSSCTAAQRLL